MPMFNIVPQPNEIIITSGKTQFVLSEETTITKVAYLEEFRDFVKRHFDVRVHREETAEAVITLGLNAEIENDEGYRLICRDGRIYIYGKCDAGVFYGLQTLKQLLIQGNGVIPDMYIEDKPLYPYRAFMLDSGRYFWTVKEVKRFIDLIALHKMNVFHWHLTEDQGWRIEINQYPLLTEKGSKRSHTNFGWKSESGFYTQVQIKEIVEYCHKRFIRVIPEFDIPGHTVSAIACYPQLSCFERHLPVATHWGVKHDILCAGKDETLQFVYNVIDEIVALFPDKMIHLGGDEAVKMRWKLCAACQKRMKDENIANEEQLQFWFMSKINAYVKSKGYQAVMWNYDGVDSTELLDVDIIWQMCGMGGNAEIVSRELEKGRRMYNSSAFPYYLDFPYSWASLKKAYEFEPELPGGSIMGIEAPLWTEYVKTLNRADYQMFPRLGAIAEIAWSNPEDRSFDRFEHGLPEYFDLLNAYGVHYATLKQAMPSKLRGVFQSLRWNKRVLDWQGLHNLIDDKRVERLAKK